jgi:trimethylamine--corrinoid protein Co-methyltransferase
MNFQLSALSPEEKQRIHADTLYILSEIGARFHSEKALDILKDNGAEINWDSKIAKIPEEMVTQALKTAPKSFHMGARNPAFDFELPSSFTRYILDGQATFAIDFETGKRRPGLLKDIADSCKIFEEMTLGAAVWPNVKAHDVPVQSMVLRELHAAFENTSKHVQHEVHHPREVPYFIDSLAAILGGEDKIKERKIMSVVYCTLPPLVHDGHMADAYLELLPYHVPIMILPMPAPGSTGPSSLYSNIAQANAEALSALVLFQMASPGTPVIIGHAPGATNFTTGGFLFGAPESAILNCGLGEMAKYYGLPNGLSACSTEAKEPGPQAIAEKMLTVLPVVLSGPDLVVGIGEVDSAQALALEQIVVDHEIVSMCKRIRDGIEVSDRKNFISDIKKVGPGGNFLTRPNTFKACRSPEFYMPELVDRSPYEAWVEKGKPDMYEKAREKVKQILSAPPKRPLTEEVCQQLEEIALKADTELKD